MLYIYIWKKSSFTQKKQTHLMFLNSLEWVSICLVMYINDWEEHPFFYFFILIIIKNLFIYFKWIVRVASPHKRFWSFQNYFHTGVAWLPSARVVRCSVESYNEQNSCFVLTIETCALKRSLILYMLKLKLNTKVHG